MKGLEWPVAERGYRWIEHVVAPASVGGDPSRHHFFDVLLPRDLLPRDLPATPAGRSKPSPISLAVDNAGYRARWYEPLKDRPTLFLLLVETPPTREAIQAFADQHGCLGNTSRGRWTAEWLRRDREPIEDPDKDFFTAVSCQELKDWQEAVGELSRAEQLRQELLKDPQDVAGRKQLQELLNEQLSIQGIGISLHLPSGDEPSEEGFLLHPPSLLGALWVQLARASLGRTPFQRCEECRNWFVRDSQHPRSNKRICSTACRSRVYRRRKEQARQLAAQGRSVCQIARTLQSDESTIRRWLSTDT